MTVWTGRNILDLGLIVFPISQECLMCGRECGGSRTVYTTVRRDENMDQTIHQKFVLINKMHTCGIPVVTDIGRVKYNDNPLRRVLHVRNWFLLIERSNLAKMMGLLIPGGPPRRTGRRPTARLVLTPTSIAYNLKHSEKKRCDKV